MKDSQMGEMHFDILTLLLGLGLGGLLGLVAGFIFGKISLREKVKAAELSELKIQHLQESREQMLAHFQSLSFEALTKNNDAFLKLAETKFKQLEESAAQKRLSDQDKLQHLITPIQTNLEKITAHTQELEKARIGAYAEVSAQIKNIRLDQDRLRQETSQLVQALRSSSTRGQWGEMQLKRTLEMSGLVEGIHYTQQVQVQNQDKEQIRPDVIVHLPGGQSIIIDAKAPLEAYLDSFRDGITPDEYKAAMLRHAKHVRDHIKALSQKSYWAQFHTPEFVIMFLPGESYLSAAFEHDPTLLEAGFEMKVIPASPTSLIAVLRAVAYGWRQEQLAKNAEAIATHGRDLYKRLVTFGEHIQKIGKGLNSALTSYNGAIGSLERNVLPAARKFKDLQGLPSDEDHLPELEPLLEKTRSLTAPEFSQEPDPEDNKASRE
jgi:DNA recombination protein RmuC